MADEQQRNTASAFPAPPPFYTHFTPENQARLKDIQSASTSNPSEDDGGDSSGADKDAPAQAQTLPPELACLIPPKPPTQGQYRSFGDTWNIPDRLPTLKELNIPQLFPEPSGESYNVDRAQELRRLSKSLLLNYLELVGIMGVSPEEAAANLTIGGGMQFEEKVYHMRIHLINIHQLINEYRPHQARETLISMMEEQLERSKQETEENRKACRKIRELMAGLDSFNANGLLSTTPEETGEGVGAGEGAGGEASKENDRKDSASWEALQQAGLA
ncbi:hypothetical protein H072_4625 [Dactylellina haptotyla CBS 200.50]|uniref:Mediator of RNA polymerase II transcription subunit 7 n=1 Tax=Dactylellina haptotyla (strain CBS 200.50) TaxID=1284197 RepID=S8BPW7_DACHA|nr:hypothetical protein H072_4625 [Dactylellina haptotyla CBS 200.50]